MRDPIVNRASSPEAQSHPPAVFRVLGGLELSTPDTAASADLLARAKPLALLLYLALAGPARVRRDTLLELFWPDADAERARSSLRQATYQLRRALGPTAILGRGDALGVAGAALRCDAVEFERCLASGDRTAAVELYRGDLLPGFFVQGAPGLERWLEERRQRLRAAASSAAGSLADAAEHCSGPALTWSRRAVELAPEDEPAARRLIGLLDRTGDRAGAVRVYDAFAHRLRDVGIEPSAETAALVATMRQGAEHAGASMPLDPRHVLVTAFDDETGDGGLVSFGRLVADTVAHSVARLDGVQVVPLLAALASMRAVEREAVPLSRPARARLAAAEFGAGTVLTGSCYVAEAQVVVQGWLVDARDGRVLAALGPVRGPVERPLAAVQALGDDARTRLAVLLETRIIHVHATARAPSYEAHAAYVEGMGRFVDGDWREALHHLEQATACDASYALPLIVSAIAHWNLGDLRAAEDAARRARPLARGAGPFERATLDMVRAWLAGDWAAAYDAVRRQVELAPGSIAAFAWAEEARRRNRPREALRLLTALEPSRGEMRGWPFYWVVMAQSLHMLGEHERELDVARRARSHHPESANALRLEVHARAALGDVPGVLACIEESLATPARQEPRPATLMREAALELRAHARSAPAQGGRLALAAAGALLQQSLAWLQELSCEERALPAVRRATARALHDVGDWDGATAAFTAIAGDDIVVRDCGAVHHYQLQAHLDHGYLGVLALRRGDEAEALRLDALLAAERGPHLFGSTHYWRAAMAALRPDRESAFRLLRRAFADGLPHEPFLHADPYFVALAGTKEFDALLAPRG